MSYKQGTFRGKRGANFTFLIPEKKEKKTPNEICIKKIVNLLQGDDKKYQLDLVKVKNILTEMEDLRYKNMALLAECFEFAIKIDLFSKRGNIEDFVKRRNIKEYIDRYISKSKYNEKHALSEKTNLTLSVQMFNYLEEIFSIISKIRDSLTKENNIMEQIKEKEKKIKEQGEEQEEEEINRFDD
jgi:hypothetical protein